MTDPGGTRRLADALRGGTPRDILAAEDDLVREERFAAVDHLTAELFAIAFSGRKLVDITHKNCGNRGDEVHLTGLDSESQRFLDRHFDLAEQESRGAWSLPQEASLRAGMVNLPAYVLTGNPFAINAARDGSVKTSLRDAPDALALWALLLPAMEELLAPIEQRSATGKVKPVEQQRHAWNLIADTYAALEIDVDEPLNRMTYGGAWCDLRIAEQRELISQFVHRLADAITPETARLWRARRVQPLAQAYFKKSKSGPPLARSVLTKALQPTFSAFFGGDWLDFVHYLGQEPNPAEEITTALPEKRLTLGTAAAVGASAQVDGEVGVDGSELGVAGEPPGPSPVDERVDVLRRWWSEFDALWSRQTSGMPSLWGLVDEGLFVLDNPRAPAPYLYRRLLTPDVCSTIDRLWEGVTLPRWPERVVSEFHPHRQMADAFGPAVAFWQGVALTCWYVCEGPSSRTTLDALGQYHGRQVTALSDTGFPIDTSLFSELARAERHLGAPEDTELSRETSSTGSFEWTMTVSAGTRRAGFEILRDIITRHRRTWAESHLEGYVTSRWDTELREVAREHARRVAAKGRAPTMKQLASFAAPSANHWFGGDLAALCEAIGETAPMTPERIDLLPGDPFTFARSVWDALGGQYLPDDASWKDRPAFDHQWQIGKLAPLSLHYVQLTEALGRPPTPKEFGASKITWDSFGGEEEGWRRYAEIIELARTQTASDSRDSIPPGPDRDGPSRVQHDGSHPN